MPAEHVSISDQLRESIRTCGLSRYRLSKLTGIPQSTLSNFMSARCGLSLTSIDRLGEAIGLALVTRGQRKRT